VHPVATVASTWCYYIIRLFKNKYWGEAVVRRSMFHLGWYLANVDSGGHRVAGRGQRDAGRGAGSSGGNGRRGGRVCAEDVMALVLLAVSGGPGARRYRQHTDRGRGSILFGALIRSGSHRGIWGFRVDTFGLRVWWSRLRIRV